MKIKLVITLVLATLLAGCANTSKNGPVDDFFEGAIKSAERRDVRAPHRQVNASDELKSDSVSGVATAISRGLAGLFDSAEND